MMIKIQAILLFALWLYGDTVYIATGEWSPWVSESLKHKGVAAHITKEAFKTQGDDVQFNFYPWKRSYVSAKVGKEDATGFWLKTKERTKDFYFSDEIFTIKNVLIFKKNKKIDFESVDDLKKYKIAVTKGYSYSQEIDDMIKNSTLKVHWVSSDLAGLRQTLKKHTFDAFICSLSVARSLLQKNFTKEQISKLQFSQKSVFEKSVYLMVSKNNKEHKQLLESFNKGLKILKSKKLINKMIEDSYRGRYE